MATLAAASTRLGYEAIRILDAIPFKAGFSD